MVRTKVFVGNLAFKTRENQLTQEFEVAGKVIGTNIITRGTRSLGYGFVEFDSEEEAQTAVKKLDKKEIDGRAINVEIAKPREELQAAQQHSGQDQQARPPRAKPSKSSPPSNSGGKRFYKTDNADSAPPPRRPRGLRPRRGYRRVDGQGASDGNATGANQKGDEADTKPPRTGFRARGTGSGFRRGKGAPRVDRPPRKPRVPNDQKEESKTTLFVANLPFALDDDTFGKVFSEDNLKFKAAHVVKKRNGRSKGYGFVEFDTEEDQKKALDKINKKFVEGRELTVKIALQEPKDTNGAAAVAGDQGKLEAATEEKKPAAAPAPAASSTPAPGEKKDAPAEKKSSPPADKKQ